MKPLVGGEPWAAFSFYINRINILIDDIQPGKDTIIVLITRVHWKSLNSMKMRAVLHFLNNHIL